MIDNKRSSQLMHRNILPFMYYKMQSRGAGQKYMTNEVALMYGFFEKVTNIVFKDDN